MNPLQPIRFAAVGIVGFVVDCGVLMILMSQGYDVIQSRLFSFLTAVTVTWGMNRVWTFPKDQRNDKTAEYIGYLVVQVVGAGINLGFFFQFLKYYPMYRTLPIVPLVVGAVPALMFNFMASRYLVFRAR